MTIVKTKVREIGTSLGVILPKEVIRGRRLKKDMEIEIIVPPQAREKDVILLEKAFGIAKKAKWKFKRDRTDRLERIGY